MKFKEQTEALSSLLEDECFGKFRYSIYEAT